MRDFIECYGTDSASLLIQEAAERLSVCGVVKRDQQLCAHLRLLALNLKKALQAEVGA